MCLSHEDKALAPQKTLQLKSDSPTLELTTASTGTSRWKASLRRVRCHPWIATSQLFGILHQPLTTMFSAFYYHAISIALRTSVYRMLFFLLIDLFAVLPAWPPTVWELWFYWAPSINLQRRQPFFPCTFILGTKQTFVRALHCLLSQDTFLWCSTLLNYAKIAYSTNILPIRFTSCYYLCFIHTRGMFSWNVFLLRHHPPQSPSEKWSWSLLYLYHSCIWKFQCGLKPVLPAALQSHKDTWSLVQELTQSCSCFLYRCRLGLVNYFIAIYLVLAGKAMQQSSPSSPFTWHLILWGNQPTPFDNGDQAISRHKVAQPPVFQED